MARPRSDDKRSAILLAATQIFGERGLGAATATISAAAGVAEGTLFVYFKTKDDLLNQLYREIKLELAGAMMSGFPRKKSVRDRFQHIWNCYTEWGVSNTERCKVLRLLLISDRLTPESKVAGTAPFMEIEAMAQDAIKQHIIQAVPLEFLSAMMESVAQTTMQFMALHSDRVDAYRNLGFDMFWTGITKR